MSLRQIKFLRLFGCIFLCQLAGLFGSIFTYPQIAGWYAYLEKPSFTPPNWVFGPAWSTLYTLMGISLYLVLESNTKKEKLKLALYVFAVQLFLNILWSLLFFGLESPFLGLICIILMWLSIVLTINVFSRISFKAAMLLLPYLAWVTFAMILNYYVWIMN
ncbi:MAG: tryptophan-rich sensory protein [Candidatus Diapherotrites archaeon]|nr:tryptophan-rich sensory protein [Candidatus Diapherotrites archaeon]